MKGSVPAVTSPDECHECQAALVRYEWSEDALLRHGGYGMTRTTTILGCPQCQFVHSKAIQSERPNR